MGKLLTFGASWIALQLIPKQELGDAIYAYTIVAFLVPFAGAGVFQSLLRFGARLKEQEQKRAMFRYTLKYGIMLSLVLALILIVLADFLTAKLPESALYLKGFFAWMLVANFLFELVKVQFRIEHNNKSFAMMDMAYSVLLILGVTLGAYFWGAKGYALAFVLGPALVALYNLRRIGLAAKQKPVIEKGFWAYGVFSSLGNVTTELLIAIDLLLIGNLLIDSELVTAYKYISLIPFSLLFLSHVFMSTHFVSLAERIEEKSYIRGFIKNYIMLFGLISAAIILGSWFLAPYLLEFLDAEYRRYTQEFMTLILGVSGVIFLRGLFGNLISAIGRAQANFAISLLALGLNLALNYKLIPELGIQGAAITSASVMWFTALLSMGVFYYFFSKGSD